MKLHSAVACAALLLVGQPLAARADNQPSIITTPPQDPYDLNALASGQKSFRFNDMFSTAVQYL